MIYKSNNVYYLKSGNNFEIANVEIKYNNAKKKNVLVVTGSGIHVSSLTEPVIEYTFRELEKELI